MTTVRVKELIEILQKLPNQDARVEVLEHFEGTGYYDQGGTCYWSLLDPTLHIECVETLNLIGEKVHWIRIGSMGN